jgi:hypothetical protein
MAWLANSWLVLSATTAMPMGARYALRGAAISAGLATLLWSEMVNVALIWPALICLGYVWCTQQTAGRRPAAVCSSRWAFLAEWLQLWASSYTVLKSLIPVVEAMIGAVRNATGAASDADATIKAIMRNMDKLEQANGLDVDRDTKCLDALPKGRIPKPRKLDDDLMEKALDRLLADQKSLGLKVSKERTFSYPSK